LRVLYFGIHGGPSNINRNCNSNVRRKLVSSYKNLFQNQSCSVGTCAGRPVRHAYRLNDGSDITDVFVSAIGVDDRFTGYNKRSYKALQQSNPFCNAGDVGTDHTVEGINLGYDDSVSPAVGPNWDTKIGESDFADLDPIRSVCDDGDEICSANNARRCNFGPNYDITCEKDSDCPGGTCEGFSARLCVGGIKAGNACNVNADCPGGKCLGTNGVVQVIFVPTTDRYTYTGDQWCDPGSVDADPGALPYLGYFGRCGDGAPAFAAGCVIGYKTCSSSSDCYFPEENEYRANGRSFFCTQQAFPGAQGFCFLGSPIGGTECRGANAWIRGGDHGHLFYDGSIDPLDPRPVFGAFYRRHMNSPGTTGSCTCLEQDASAQLGCLVGCGEACSVGYARNTAIKPAGKSQAVAYRGVLPSKSAIQALVSNDGLTFFNRYRLSTKLTFSTLVGYGETAFNNPGDPTGPGVSGDELNMVKCAANPDLQSMYETSLGFYALPNNAPFCEDFVEGWRCLGGLHPGKACTQDSDCPGLVDNGVTLVFPGFCGGDNGGLDEYPDKWGCSNAANVNACANNGNVGLPQ
jgi:hypothetical protein